MRFGAYFTFASVFLLASCSQVSDQRSEKTDGEFKSALVSEEVGELDGTGEFGETESVMMGAVDGDGMDGTDIQNTDGPRGSCSCDCKMIGGDSEPQSQVASDWKECYGFDNATCELDSSYEAGAMGNLASCKWDFTYQDMQDILGSVNQPTEEYKKNCLPEPNNACDAAIENYCSSYMYMVDSVFEMIKWYEETHGDINIGRRNFPEIDSIRNGLLISVKQAIPLFTVDGPYCKEAKAHYEKIKNFK